MTVMKMTHKRGFYVKLPLKIFNFVSYSGVNNPDKYGKLF